MQFCIYDVLVLTRRLVFSQSVFNVAPGHPRHPREHCLGGPHSRQAAASRHAAGCLWLPRARLYVPVYVDGS